jgi:predicted nuclease of predicted toxin-antitoxin system
MGSALSNSAESKSEWFEVSESDWLPPLTPTKKLKLFADASVPATIVKELRSAGISVESALDQGLPGADDQAVLGVARKQGKVLLTMDVDFWNETKFPVHQVHGIIFVDVSPSDIDDALQALGLLYGCFAERYPLDWWQGMKARATPQGFILKIRTWEGRNQQYEFRLSGDKRLMARET